MLKMFLAISLMVFFSCSRNDDFRGHYSFFNGCPFSDEDPFCAKWIGTYHIYKKWIESHPLKNDFKAGVWVDSDNNLIRDDIDYFIDYVIKPNYDFFDDMISLLKQYAKIHGRYSRESFSLQKAKYLLNNEYWDYRFCRKSFLSHEKKYNLLLMVLEQLDYLFLRSGENKNYFLYLSYLEKNKKEKLFFRDMLESILLMPKFCKFEIKNGKSLFQAYLNPGKYKRFIDWEKKKKDFEKKYGTSYRKHYNKFNTEK